MQWWLSYLYLLCCIVESFFNLQILMMNKYQRRVKVSMERLNIPSWYKSPVTTSHTPTRLAAGWRRHLSQSPAYSNTEHNQEVSLKLPVGQRQSRVQNPRTVGPSSCVPYLGWRQEYLEGRLYLGPKERLARSCRGLDKIHSQDRH